MPAIYRPGCPPTASRFAGNAQKFGFEPQPNFGFQAQPNFGVDAPSITTGDVAKGAAVLGLGAVLGFFGARHYPAARPAKK